PLHQGGELPQDAPRQRRVVLALAAPLARAVPLGDPAAVPQEARDRVNPEQDVDALPQALPRRGDGFGHALFVPQAPLFRQVVNRGRALRLVRRGQELLDVLGAQRGQFEVVVGGAAAGGAERGQRLVRRGERGGRRRRLLLPRGRGRRHLRGRRGRGP